MSASPGCCYQQLLLAGYPFHYLYNESQDTAKAYKAACTPEFYLADSNLKLVYHGQFDGSRPSNDVPVTGSVVRAVPSSHITHARRVCIKCIKALALFESLAQRAAGRYTGENIKAAIDSLLQGKKPEAAKPGMGCGIR